MSPLLLVDANVGDAGSVRASASYPHELKQTVAGSPPKPSSSLVAPAASADPPWPEADFMTAMEAAVSAAWPSRSQSPPHVPGLPASSLLLRPTPPPPMRMLCSRYVGTKGCPSFSVVVQQQKGSEIAVKQQGSVKKLSKLLCWIKFLLNTERHSY